MKSKSCVTVALFLLLLVASNASSQEVINDAYRNWNQFEVGTSITLKTTSKMGDQTVNETRIVQKLLKKTDSEIVIEMSTVVSVNGMEFKTPPVNFKHMKTIQSSPANPDEKSDTQFKELGKGKETIKVGDTSYDCNWVATSTTFQGIKSESKSWMSDKVPGMIVKSVVKTMATEVTTELVSVSR